MFDDDDFEDDGMEDEALAELSPVEDMPDDDLPDDELEQFGLGDEAAPAALGGDDGGEDAAALLAAFGGGEPSAPGGDAQLAWRETYYVLFQRGERPTLTQVEAAIEDASRRLEVENLEADEDGLFQSVLIQAPQDNAALEISYEAGDAVVEQSAELAKSLQEDLEGDQLAKLLRSDARLDVMHFERVGVEQAFGDDEGDPVGLEALDPATLITVVEALANLTDGLAVDPAAGELLI